MDRRPIGYWLKEIDRLIEEDFARLLAAEGLTRRHWQVLNTIAKRPRSLDELDGKLSPFLSAQVPSVTPVVEELRAKGWVDATIALTEKGTERHAEVSARVRANRQRLTEGITAEEYASVVDLLERMAANLNNA